MQTSFQMNCEQNTDSTETSMGSDAQLMINEQSPEEEDHLSALDHDGTLVIALEENEEPTTETPATEEEAEQTVKSNPVENSSQPNSNSQSDSTPGNDLNVKDVRPKPKNPNKPARDGRKYIPSKKAMTDPLKMDMSKPPPTPLSSSQMSLQCIECHIIFSDHKSKERHLKASHPAEYEQSILRNALFACYVCDRHFTNSSELMVHQKTHIEKKPFKCPICSTTFSKLSELSNHKKIHFGLHGYTCTECGKPCKTLTLLKYHCRTHTGERPYVCKECGKRFTMPKALQKHMDSHLPEGAQPKKEDAPSVVYTCPICKATFKSTKTRHYHMKKQHNIAKAALTKTSAQLVKQCTPIITPIAISQTSLLQAGPNGPLQKVDANIDTEQLRKLIESLGNVQKVNQVVILGQVPPDAPPLEVQQLAQPATLNMDPPQVDFVGVNPRTNDTTDDPMEQTIILEPITPDGQLLNPPFSSLESNMGGSQVAEVIFQQPTETSTEQQHTEEMICHSSVLGQNLQPNLNQTIVLELTPALTPTAELEQSGNVLQAEIPSVTSVQSNELEMPLVETSISEQETSMSVQSLLSTVELEMLPLQNDQQMVSACTFSPQETLPESVTQDEPDPLLPTKTINTKVQNVTEEENKTGERSEGVTTEHEVTTEPDSVIVTEGTVNKVNEAKRKKAGKTVKSQVKAKKVEQASELPINVMSAQELVKVRKRKPPKAFFFQGHMQEFVSSIYDEFPTRAAQCKITKKSHLVVKFGPPSKEKQSRKADKTPKQQTKDELKDTSPKSKIQKKGKKEKKVVNSDCTPEIEVPALFEEKDSTPKQNKNNKKKQKVATKNEKKHNAVPSPVFKKKQKKIIQSKSVKGKSETNKQKASDKAKEKSSPQSKAESADKSTSHVIQDSLLLLKGHKQPQLKVHKLDPLKASGKTQDMLIGEPLTSPKDKDSPASTEISPTNKKKGGRSKKALTLLSSLISKKQEATPPKPASTRKRKASSKVETEGVITSKKSIECKECGQRFNDVLLLQRHKAMVHIVESPGITFTNGNLFEGVTRIDLYHLPKQDSKGTGLNAGWDTESEMAELERERCVSFPALNTSPSLPVPPCDIYCSYEDDKGGKDIDDDGLNASPPKVVLTSPQLDGANKEHKSCTDMEVQATTDEDIKEDLVLEVDLVTVGEQSMKDDSSLSPDENVQNRETDQARDEREGPAVKQTDPTLHTVSCSTHQHEIKEEEEETVIERKKDGQKEVTSIEREVEKGRVSGEELEELPVPDNCEILSEKRAADSDSDNRQDESHQVQIITKSCPEKDVAPASAQPLIRDEEVRVDQEHASRRNDTEANEERQAGDGWERDPSPGIILEKVISSNLLFADKGTNQLQLLENENQEIKIEDSTADSTQGVTRCASVQPRNRDIRAVLVKEEGRQTPQSNQLIQWSTEHNSNSSSPLVNEAIEATDSIAPNCNSSQCVFYPVKEEEREVLVGPAEGGSRPASVEAPSAHHHPKLPAATNDVVLAEQEVSSEPGINNPSDGQDAESEEETTPNLCDFLLQSSDEEDCTSDWTDSHLDSEAEIMSCLYKKQRGPTNRSSTSSAATQESTINKPVIYFSKYFNFNTWREISHCTNKLVSMSTPVTAKEVGQFVGIHIAMGSLKYPSPRLYWEDLTKVPLVADAMPLSRFLELSRQLKLAYPQDNQPNSNSRRDGNISLSNISSNRHYNNFQHHKTLNADPLWKIQPVLKCFVRGCRSLKRQGDYAIDQYALPLTGRTNNNKHSLHCTALFDFGGMVLDFDIKLDLSNKEDVIEKLAPKESMVFLCKQELSTPAMLEHLLTAGKHGAGQVGGAKGQIGDEFVSSDGKLMLRRSHCGFILSTTGNNQRNNSTLIDNFENAQISTLLNKNLQRLYSISPSDFSSNCWPQTVLWFLIDLALINSWLLYRQDATNVATPLTLLAFRLEVSKALILTSGLDTQDSLSNQTENAHTPSDTPNPSLLHENPLPDATTRYDGLGHWPEQLAEGEGGRCRFGDCQRTSRVLCLKCCVFLCISRNHNCFINFHNQGHQEK